MDGYGFNDQLPDSLKRRIPNSMIFNGNDNEGSPNGGISIWSPVEPAMAICSKQMAFQTLFLKCLVQSSLQKEWQVMEENSNHQI